MNAFKFLNNTTALEQAKNPQFYPFELRCQIVSVVGTGKHICCFLNLSVKAGFTPLIEVQWECSEGKIKVICKVLHSSYKKQQHKV